MGQGKESGMYKRWWPGNVVWRWCKSLYEADYEWRAEHEPMAEVESEGAILGAGDPKLKPLIIGEPGTD